MSVPRRGFPPTPAQRRAADPKSSVWVTANAGTGKTRVLSDRVLRLLLAGADPEGILCITFTKAAAAEMTARIEQRLAAWATASDDAALAAEIEELTGEPADEERLRQARRLFALVLELPRGLNIMTIHALCGSLLRRFPLEAEVPPHFETIDERTAAELLREARERVLMAGRDRDSALGRALETLAVTLTERTLTETLEEILGQRTRLLRARAACGGDVEALIAAVYRALGVEPGHEPSLIEHAACADGVYDAEGLLHAARALSRGSDKDCERGQLILTWLDCAHGDRVRLFVEYKRCFLKTDGGPLKSLGTKKVLQDERVLRILTLEQARLVRLADQIRGLMIARRTEALLRVGFAAIDSYEALKRHAAGLDYDDLIERVRVLLSRPGKTEWVLFKLDCRIDHVLVDEAQDTSPAQWAIIEKLTEEFFAGAGARPEERTLFVVGDEKQSIYSFQGADLDNFRRVKERMVARAAAAGKPIRPEMLDRSFRSVKAVLNVVDAVFALPEAKAGVVDMDDTVHHATERANDAGLVELWPLAQPAELGPSEEPWPLPDAPRVSDEPERRVARAIATTVKHWLEQGERLESTGRPIRAGDVLVLVSRRGIVQELVIRALKHTGVPVAGADRLSLREHIAVQDLIALGRAMLLPEDDLNLACLLKSPLVGLGEDDLFELAWDRGAASLMERLREAAERRPQRFGGAYERIARWLQRADFMPPFEFYAWVLGADGGRKRLLARLGPDAIEPIEAFLGQTLAYEQGHPSSLQGFLHWICMGEDELKRDPEKVQDMVRVTTVHGAKGLEAPIVFLADAGPRGQARRGRLLWGSPDPEGGSPELPFWRSAKGEREGFTERLAQEDARREAEERRRLLYVALTRARDRLYVTGWLPRNVAKGQAPDGDDEGAGGAEPSWHELVGRAMEAMPDVERFEIDLGKGFAGTALRLRRGVAATVTAAPLAGAAVKAEPLPLWASAPAPEEARPPRPLAPSRQEGEPEEPPPSSPTGAEASLRFRYGILVHRLLQLLPDVPPEQRPAAADRLLRAFADDLAPEQRARLAGRVLDLVAMPEMAPVFAPGSRVEQPLCGVVGGQVIVGQIDRLAVTADEVLLVDYKSNRTPPRTIEATPVAYLRQLAAYRALLRSIYPGRTIKAALLWTEVPRLDLLPLSLLDRYMPAG
ncbi:double-strand break repair helicase AddA [Benzoatithermus flavus]|uniref:DNA 3'-5' helicase n=1 Tax=Benzoatithermus flavus TaxID=3108223 RepID=A0ABU8XLX4_9PROT